DLHAPLEAPIGHVRSDESRHACDERSRHLPSCVSMISAVLRSAHVPSHVREARAMVLVLAAASAIAGAIFLANEPPVSTFDAQAHYFRTAQIAEGIIRPAAAGPGRLGGAFDRRTVDFGTHRITPGPRTERVPVEFTNTAVYSPANYVPQAIG